MSDKNISTNDTSTENVSTKNVSTGNGSKKNISRKKRRRRLIRRIILMVVVLILITGLALFAPKIIKVVQLANEAKEIVEESSANTFREAETTVIYDADGNELCTMRDSKDMYYVNFSDIPDTLVQSFIIMEDKDFYEHNGIDLKAIIRAIIANTESDDIVQGASTITQQVAKNIFLTQDVTWERKIKEMFVARELEKKYSKTQILEFYLNNIYFGNGYYGVGAAAKGYFGKSVEELTLSEQTFIAAIPNNPTKYNPLTNYDNTIERRNMILKKLYEDDYISSMNYYTAADSSVKLSEQPTASVNSSVETYARHCATEGLMEANGFVFRTTFNDDTDYESYKELYDESYTTFQQMLMSGGYTVYTSIDMNIQAKLQAAVDDNLSDYTTQEDGVYEMQAAATCIDNETGNVVAIVGSRSQELEGYTLNRAYQSYRQPGSSIKPIIVYLPYLQAGNTPDTIVSDVYSQNGPNNADGSYLGDITLRTAVSLSKNTVAWNILNQIGTRVGSSYLLSQGFHKVWMDRDYNAIALGGFTYGVSSVEMAGAYATIAHDGEYREPTCVVLIKDSYGKTVLDTSNREQSVYDTTSCRMMTDMLETVMSEGTGKGASPDNAIVAGKTGTTNSNYDSWFCGYSAYYTVAVWQGYDYPASIPEGRTKEIFKQFMQQVHEGLALKEFPDYEGEENKKETETESESESETDTSAGDDTVDITGDGTVDSTVDSTSGNNSNGSSDGAAGSDTSQTESETERVTGVVSDPDTVVDTIQGDEIVPYNSDSDSLH